MKLLNMFNMSLKCKNLSKSLEGEFATTLNLEQDIQCLRN
jgi:hypothetical protein